MQAFTFDLALRKIAATSISGYQKHISPHKGFSCAHRVLYGSESCSQFFKRVITEEGIISATKASKWRFQACREANQIIRASRISQNQICRPSQEPRSYILATQSTPDNSESGSEDDSNLDEIPLEEQETSEPVDAVGASTKKNNFSEGLGDACNCGDDACDLGQSCVYASDGCSNVNCSGLEAMDCSGLDCSGLDCGALDCGSCGS